MKLCAIGTGLLFLAFLGNSARVHAQDVLPAAEQRTPQRSIGELRPEWAVARNDLGALPPDEMLSDLTIIVKRTPEQQAAFVRFAAEQQDPASPDYHHWLTPAEIGERFGRTSSELQSLTGWLRANGLTVTHISAGNTRVRFRGTVAQVSEAFQTSIHQFRVPGNQGSDIIRFSITSDPVVPGSIAPIIRSIRGLSSIDESPLQHERATPAYTDGSAHLIAPADFATIYDIPSTLTGAGVTVGIVAQSRTNMADYAAFRQATGLSFANPTEVVPTGLGGIDPGPALTAPPPAGFPTNEQQEATMDVQRVAGTAPGASVLLVTSTADSGGIGLDAEYMVDTTPVPVNIISISAQSCEMNAAPEVAFWDDLFQQAAAEGISSFVASGDGGASCALNGSSPAPAPAIAPNALCSSAYVTCVGGTELNDTGDPSQYWASTSGANQSSALGYIPEGAWNEPLAASGATQISASGGGVSAYIPTPLWQTGTGFPPAAAGRYTPDVAFSASAHDGYYICMAAVGGCGGPWLGTSASAPGMAGIAALLDQQTGQPQGTLNPALYSIAASDPSAFHNVTVSSSGVTDCNVNVASMCNNSIPGPDGPAGGEAGYLLTDGYSEVTGLGSLDVSNFLNHFASVLPLLSGITVTPSTIPNGGKASVEVALAGAAPAGGASVTLSSSNAALLAVTSPLLIAAGQRTGTFTVQAGTVTTATAVTLTAALNGSSERGVSTISPAADQPTVTLALSSSAISTSEALTVTVNVSGGTSLPTPTGSVNIAFASGYNSYSYNYTLGSGSATLTVPANALAAGDYVVAATYVPDSQSSLKYVSASTQARLHVDTTTTPQIYLTLSSSSINVAEALTVTARVQGGTGNGTPGDGNGTPAGTIVLTSGSYTSATATLSGGGGIITIPANALPMGTDDLTVTYTPSSASAATFNHAQATASVVVTAAPAFTLSASPGSVSLAQGATANSTITITGAGGFSGVVALTAGNLPSGVTASFAAGSVSGTQVLTLAATTSAAVTASPINLTITGTSGPLTATTEVAISITAEPSFSGTSGETTTITVNPGASTGNTGTVSVVGTNGFSGTVALSCTVTTALTNVNDMPACTVSPSSVSVSGTAAQNATVTVTTVAATSAAMPTRRFPWQLPGGTALALLGFWILPRRRKWSTTAGLLLAFVSVAAIGCGGGGTVTGTGLPGTTAGDYTLTITGTSGSLSVVIDTITLTVQ